MQAINVKRLPAIQISFSSQPMNKSEIPARIVRCHLTFGLQDYFAMRERIRYIFCFSRKEHKNDGRIGVLFKYPDKRGDFRCDIITKIK